MDLPVIDLAPYLEIRAVDHETQCLGLDLQSLCSEVSRTLRDTGALLVKDPRCSVEDNDRFLDMMELYFQKSQEFKRLQERPHLHYQVGVTPEGVEVPRSLVDEEMQQKIKSMPKEFQPSAPVGPDPKWRYMWRVGPRPSKTRFQVVAEMAAIGFGLPKDAFTSLMKQEILRSSLDSLIGGHPMEACFGLSNSHVDSVEGPHLLAPTGSDLQLYGHEGRVFAGFHYDLNFLTIHGRSRFPGLNIWLRNGQKVAVKVPVGCLLIQTGKQLEWLTGGECLAGLHEVVVTNRTLDAIESAKQKNHSLWRVSSTLFGHIASDAVLKPLGHFADSPLASKYPPICAGEFVELELAVINLKGKQEK
ncbi:hypothetical protein ACLOJK_017371 [Asimina triloba]